MRSLPLGCSKQNCACISHVLVHTKWTQLLSCPLKWSHEILYQVMCIFSICVTDLASAGQCGKHLVNSCILQGIVTAAAATECVVNRCVLLVLDLVHLCLCKLQWYSSCVLLSAGVPQATFRGSASTFPL